MATTAPSAPSCPDGYSPISATDPRCARNCAERYYADGILCWPMCPAGSLDLGGSCGKKQQPRAPLYPITGYNADGSAIRSANTTARCPPGYTQYDSISEADTWWNDTVTPETTSTVRAAKCFPTCPTADPGQPQGILDDTGLCGPDVCPVNETKTPYGGDASGSYTQFPEAAAGELPTLSSGSTIDARTKVCKRDPTGTQSASNPGGEKIVRTFDLPTCPLSHEIALYDSNGGTTTYTTLQGFADAKKSDNTNIYTSFATFDANAAFPTATQAQYQRYFSCTFKCPANTQRIGKYCYYLPQTKTLLEHVDDSTLSWSMPVAVTETVLVSPGDQDAFDPLIEPSDTYKLRRVMKTYRVAYGDSANNIANKFRFTYTSKDGAFPDVTVLEYTTINGTAGWYEAVYSSSAGTGAFAAPDPSTANGCPTGFVRVPRWRDPQATDAAVIAAKAFAKPTLDGVTTTEAELARRWAKRLFMYDTGSAPQYALWSSTFACMKGPVVCKKQTAPHGVAPVGFVESVVPTTTTSTQTTYDANGQPVTTTTTTTKTDHSLTVFCSPYGTSDADACSANGNIGMTNDPEIANLCVRRALYQDPETVPANTCSGSRVLMGKTKQIPDLSSANAEGGYDGFYDAEEAVTQLISNPGTKRAQCDELYSETKVYKYDDVVAFGQDKRAELDADGNEWTGEAGKGIPNPKYNEYLAPFFRCIRATGAAFGPAAAVFPAGYNRNAASLGTTVAERAQASYLADEYAASDVGVPLSSTYWTTTNVPNQIALDGLRRAGVAGLHKTKCTRDGDTLKYCPPMCVDPCPQPQPDPSDPTSQYGLYEPVYEADSSGQATAAVCYPRCGSTKQFTATGRYCIAKRSEMAKPMVAGFSWCSPDGIAPIRDRSKGELPSGPSTDTTATTKEACEAKGYHWTNSTCYVVNHKCYDVCPQGFAVYNQSPYTTCITECPQNERFVDAEDRCIKVPYQRALAPGTASDTPLTFAEQQAIVESDFAGTATTVSKFALAGGTDQFLRSISFAIAIAVGLLLLIIFVKRSRITAVRGV